MRRIDEREMRERLGKVAELAAAVRVVFLGQQPHVVAQRQQALEQSESLVMPSQQHVIVDEPEAAREKRALAGRQAVDRRSRIVAHHKSVAQKPAFNRSDRALDARIVRRQEADDGNEQQARVQRRVAERLDEGVFAHIIPVRADLCMDRSAGLAPALERSLEPEFLDRAHRAIECNPRHHLRMREMAPSASHFPDALVRLSPDGLEVQQEGAFQRPGCVAGGETSAARDIKSVEHLAVDVELELSDRAVADTDRRRSFVTRQPRDLKFLEPSFARYAIENLQVVRGARDRPQEPLVPRLGLVENASANQRIKGESRVAEPAKSIVPIAGPTQLLWQRCRWRSDDAACLPMRKRFQSQKRAEYRVAPSVSRFENRRPAGPERMNLLVCGLEIVI